MDVTTFNTIINENINNQDSQNGCSILNMWGCMYCKVAHVLKKQKSTKVHFKVLNYLVFLIP